MDPERTTSTFENLYISADYAGYTIQLKIAAVNSNGAEGAHSNVVSITVTGGTQQPSYSLNGTWKAENTGNVFTINGSTGVFSAFGTSKVWLDAKNKGYVQIGSQKFKNLTSTGTLTWSGQELCVLYKSSNPNVATGTSWENTTFTLSADGKTLQTYTPNASDPSGTLKRQ